MGYFLGKKYLFWILIHSLSKICVPVSKSYQRGRWAWGLFPNTVGSFLPWINSADLFLIHCLLREEVPHIPLGDFERKTLPHRAGPFFFPFLSESELFLESELRWDPLRAGFVSGGKGRVADLGACSAGCLGPGIRY